MDGKILIVEDEPEYQQLYRIYLQAEGYQIETAGGRSEAEERFNVFHPEVVLLDLLLPPGTVSDGLELLSKILEIDSSVKVIVLTGHGTPEIAQTAIEKGACDFLEKGPYIQNELPLRVQKAFQTRQMEQEIESFRRFAYGPDEKERLIGTSEKMLQIYQQMERLAQTDSNLLITGETGTGKSMIARAIHQSSGRKKATFVSVNCHLPVELVESELFGYKPGAHSTARQGKKGMFQVASGGTLFLDEIGQMPREVQVKLLNVIGDRGTQRDVMPLGATSPDKVDVRLICATHESLPEAIEKGTFRADLYERIKTVSLTIPPLRDRKEDIRALAEHFLKLFLLRENKQSPRQIAPEALKILHAYNWPRNLRQLANVIEYAAIFAKSHYILPMDLPADLTNALGTETADRDTSVDVIKRENIDLKSQVENLSQQIKTLTQQLQDKVNAPVDTWRLKDIENHAKKHHVKRCLQHTNGDIEQARQLLDISRRHLNRLIKDFQLS